VRDTRAEGWKPTVGTDLPALSAFAGALMGSTPGTVALARVGLDGFERVFHWYGDDTAGFIWQTIADRLLGAAGEPQRLVFLTDVTALVLLDVRDGRYRTLSEAAWDLMETVAATIDVPDGPTVSIGSSVGLAHAFETRDGTFEGLMNGAGVAYQRAAARGARRVEVFLGDQAGMAGIKSDLVRDLKGGIAKNQIVPFFQPKFSVRDSSIVGVEALVRWVHPTHGLVLPHQFMPEAERSGIVREVDTEILRLTCAAAAAERWPADLPLSVNLSSANLDDPHLANRLSRIVRDAGLQPDRFVFEISESGLAGSRRIALQRIQDLRDRGFRLALDEFGSGHAFLDTLSDHYFEEVKVNRALVFSASRSVADQSLLRGVVDIGHRLHLTVAGEGLDSHVLFDVARSVGCDAAQGDFLAEAMTAPQFTTVLAEPIQPLPQPHIPQRLTV
jgi:EAL domain-containing protein (putative c-di-GMP-specific phosphodiesterase class I)/GGDEF domain-containing protein